MKKTLLLLQIFVLLNYSFVFCQTNLYINFTSEKSVYTEQEPITINFKLINNTGKTVSFNAGCLDHDIITGLSIVDEKGKRYKYHGIVVDCIGVFFSLKKGDFKEFAKSLEYGYGVDSAVTTGKSVYRNFLPTGKYYISYKGNIGSNVYAISDTLSFTVAVPETKDGFDILKSSLLLFDKSKKSNSLKNFIYNYPESPYLFIAFDMYLRLYGEIIKKYEMYDFFKFYFSKRYESWNVRKNVYDAANVINWLEGEEKMIDFLVYIGKKYPGTKAGFTAKEILQREIPNDLYINMLINN